jgi:hypothetical protein
VAVFVTGPTVAEIFRRSRATRFSLFQTHPSQAKKMNPHLLIRERMSVFH